MLQWQMLTLEPIMALEIVEEHQKMLVLRGQGLCGELYGPVNEIFNMLRGRMRLLIFMH